MYAMSGGLPPATCAVSFSLASSAGTFCNSILMFGCSPSNFWTSVLKSGSSPTHDENVTVTGEVGSGTGPSPAPLSVDEPPPVEHAASASAAVVVATTVARDLRDRPCVIGSAP